MVSALSGVPQLYNMYLISVAVRKYSILLFLGPNDPVTEFLCFQYLGHRRTRDANFLASCIHLFRGFQL